MEFACTPSIERNADIWLKNKTVFIFSFVLNKVITSRYCPTHGTCFGILFSPKQRQGSSNPQRLNYSQILVEYASPPLRVYGISSGPYRPKTNCSASSWLFGNTSGFSFRFLFLFFFFFCFLQMVVCNCKSASQWKLPDFVSHLVDFHGFRVLVSVYLSSVENVTLQFLTRPRVDWSCRKPFYNLANCLWVFALFWVTAMVTRTS